MKKIRTKTCVVALIVILGFIQLDSSVAHATNEQESKITTRELDNRFGVTTLADGTGKITTYHKDRDSNYPNVVIPEVINGITITEIAGDTFKNKGLVSIDMPDTIKTLWMEAFKWNNLERVKLSANLTEIPINAFYGNKELKSIEIPASVTKIGPSAFSKCGITSVYIPDSVSEISLQSFSMNDLSEVRLPSMLREIPSGCFSDNKNLKHIEIPDSVTKIANDAFRDSGLESIKLPKNLSWLGTSSFMNNKIESVIIPGTVKDWGHYAFGNNAIKTVVVEEGVTTIDSDFTNSSDFGENMFNNISSLTLPSTLESIKTETFSNSSLLYIDLPANTTSLGRYCFEGQEVTMDYLIEKDKSVVILPNEMTMTKLKVSTPGVDIDNANHKLSIPKDLKQIEYSYELGSFDGVERYLTGTLILGKGTIKVRFLDYDDSVLEEVNTVINETVVPTKTPTRDGYTFIGWDKSLDNITESQDIKAQYKRLPEITVEDKLIKVGDSFNPLKDVKAIDADGNEIKDIKVIENTVNTTKEGTYYVTLEVNDQWGGKATKQYNVTVESKYIYRVLIDKTTGIIVEGYFTKDARLVVELTDELTNSLNDKIDDKDLVNSYEVYVVGEYQGKLKVKFPIDNGLNGTKIYIYHERDDGVVEEFERIANKEYVVITVDELSPFAIAKTKSQDPIMKPEEPVTPENKVNSSKDTVKTGDQTSIIIPTVLLIMTGTLLITLRKKRNKV